MILIALTIKNHNDDDKLKRSAFYLILNAAPTVLLALTFALAWKTKRIFVDLFGGVYLLGYSGALVALVLSDWVDLNEQ